MEAKTGWGTQSQIGVRANRSAYEDQKCKIVRTRGFKNTIRSWFDERLEDAIKGCSELFVPNCTNPTILEDIKNQEECAAVGAEQAGCYRSRDSAICYPSAPRAALIPVFGGEGLWGRCRCHSPLAVGILLSLGSMSSVEYVPCRMCSL